MTQYYTLTAISYKGHFQKVVYAPTFFTLLRSTKDLSGAPAFFIKFTLHVEYWHCVSVLQVEFEQFKDTLILVLSSTEETLAKENPPRPGNIILYVSVLKFNDHV